MNRYCKSLLVKNFTSLNSLNSKYLIKEPFENIRILSTIAQYSLFNKSKVYQLKPTISSHLSVLNKNHTQARYLARNTSKKKNSSEYFPKNNSKYQENFKNHTTSNTKQISVQKSPKIDQSVLFKPLEVKPLTEIQDDIGIELGGKIEKSDINRILINFRQDEKVLELARESGLNSRMFNDVLLSFRKFCLQSKALPPDLHIKLSDIIRNAANQTDLFPYFLRHAHELFPHLNCMDDLKHISDLTEPSFWYVEARDIKRKIIYHAGPTNSGKTYSALKRFQESESGIYCGPLKLLANEVFTKTNKNGKNCDLITGEERKFGDKSGNPSNHVACTVEMANLEKNYDVAIIDEIQMIKDQQRGWAWTRALLGLKAKEIHVCGDLSTTDLLSDISFLTGDEYEIRTYERLTSLNIMNKSLESYDNVQPGDCFVCFNKNDIFTVLNNLESRGHEVALIYGSMPPGVKLAQAARFNDPNDKCKILVATDAIGMGLNLNIRRIIFYSLKKIQNKDDSDKETFEIENITTSQALQIAGRAGRFNTAFQDGFVTTFKSNDLPILKDILKQPLEKTTKAGLHPTAEQIELFAYHLPNHSLSDLLKIFLSICTIDNGQYFLCNFGEIVYLAEMIDHIPIKLRAKYTFATSPINRKQTFVCSCFVKFVRYYSNNEVVTDEILKKIIDWPCKIPENVNQVAHLESVYDLLDLYLWLSYRFPEIFTYTDEVKQMRIELEQIIYEGVRNISLLNQTHTRHVIKRNIKRNDTQNSNQTNQIFDSNAKSNTTNSIETNKNTNEKLQNNQINSQAKENEDARLDVWQKVLDEKKFISDVIQIKVNEKNQSEDENLRIHKLNFKIKENNQINQDENQKEEKNFKIKENNQINQDENQREEKNFKSNYEKLVDFLTPPTNSPKKEVSRNKNLSKKGSKISKESLIGQKKPKIEKKKAASNEKNTENQNSVRETFKFLVNDGSIERSINGIAKNENNLQNSKEKEKENENNTKDNLIELCLKRIFPNKNNKK